MTNHKDCLGQKLEVGDYVAGIFPTNETPQIFVVVSFTPKKVTLDWLDNDDTTSKFPQDLLKIDPAIMAQHLSLEPIDALGQKLEVGDYVFGSDASYIDPVIFKIVMFHPRKAVLEKVMGKRSYIPNKLRHTTDLIKVDPKLITMYNLTKGNDDG